MPEYTVHPGYIMVKFTGPEDRIVRVKSGLSDKLSDKERKILELIIEDPGYSSRQIAEILNISRVTVTKYIQTLKEKRIITRVGSDRKGYWQINQTG